MKIKQYEMILNYIKENGSITAKEAYREFDCMRLAAQIHILKRQGVSIISRLEKSKNRYGKTTYYSRYSLVEGGAE
jgi:hypothetical protein